MSFKLPAPLVLGGLLGAALLQSATGQPLDHRTARSASVPVNGTNLNILIEGQSNAGYFLIDGGATALVAKVQALLGFDGVKQSVSVLGALGKSCIFGTYLVGTPGLPPSNVWLTGSAATGWTNAINESLFIAYIEALPAAIRSRPTVILWIHNEQDSTNGAVTRADWESAIRFNIGAVRHVFGQTAATMPMDIVYVPYDPVPGHEQSKGLSSEVETLKSGFEGLAADTAFNAVIAAQAGDSNMDGPPGKSVPYGGPHFDQADIDTVSARLAVTIANQFWLYAQPGSPEAVAKGTLDNTGPMVETASRAGSTALVVAFTPSPTGGGIRGLSDVAASGAGWSVVDASGVLYASHATRVGRKLVLTFSSTIPTTSKARLYYGWGTGRIFALSAPPPLNTTTEGPGQGSAVYDQAGLPAWTPAGGVPLR